jgi:hypothetical protein
MLSVATRRFSMAPKGLSFVPISYSPNELVTSNTMDCGRPSFTVIGARCPIVHDDPADFKLGREPINSEWSADVALGAHFGLESEITALPKKVPKNESALAERLAARSCDYVWRSNSLNERR